MINNWIDINQHAVIELANSPNVTLVDVREPDEFNEGHIPQAINIPLSEFTNRVTELKRENNLIVICRGGNRSKKACEHLSFLGFNHINNLVGGMLEWDGDIAKGGKK
ncbi:rhodanese-like domain-containing protein [Paenibacillus alginolyticus]|uniref:Rhodanese-like domain-containing protein n=1 Tax=Paenibacillus alginolyticus TaxID=59839 RepID=A0ABT4GN02_9BACL|nr:rhodanese-like domain-containing protein [Paenibacillus alginolyticus]MCY9697579.1 rhodanese-like domain-containing protein [Paenibacillus alginolyticus]MEC0143353.1 rhodanese-like domain-containing protein [Paenibacillus alginolyticus]